MDYEKKYKEALALAHSYYNKDSMNAFLDTIFPELRESEDERIRKSIIECVKEQIRQGNYLNINGDKAIAYLEKQKEQRHDEDDFTIYHPLKNGKGEYECIPYSFYGSLTSFSKDKDLIDFLRTCFYTKEECNEWIEKQKEQKPAEWSEVDRHNLNSVISLVHGTTDGAWGSCIGDRIENWLKSLRPSWKPSEEQMDRLFSIIAALRKAYCDDMADFLANLRTDLKKLGVKEEPEYYQHFDPDC